jgi:hypothetical protein
MPVDEKNRLPPCPYPFSFTDIWIHNVKDGIRFENPYDSELFRGILKSLATNVLFCLGTERIWLNVGC